MESKDEIVKDAQEVVDEELKALKKEKADEVKSAIESALQGTEATFTQTDDKVIVEVPIDAEVDRDALVGKIVAEKIKEAEEEAARIAAEKVKQEQERIRREAEEKALAEARAKAEVEARAKAEAEMRARAEAEAREKAEAEKRAKAEAERIARVEAETKAKAETEERARAEAEAREKAEAEKRAKAEAETKAKAEAERKAKVEAEARAKAEEEKKARAAEAEAKAKAEAEKRAKAEAEAKKKAEENRKQAEEQRARDEKARKEAEKKSQEVRAKAEAERKEREAKAEANRIKKTEELRNSLKKEVEKTSSSSDKFIPNFKNLYLKKVRAGMQEKFNYFSTMQIPKIEKIVVSIGCGQATENKKYLDAAVSELEAITGQHVVRTKARKSIASFKVREGQEIGAMTTLRGDNMWYFLERLISIALPRVRDFRGVNPKAFDGRGNYSLGITEQIIFPEIDFDKIERVSGMNVAIVTTAKSDEEGYELLKQLGMPFAAKVER